MNVYIARALTTTVVAAGFTASAWMGIAIAHAEPSTPEVSEDAPGFDCRTMGNRICGPDNTQGVYAGQYDENGYLIDFWPVS